MHKYRIGNDHFNIFLTLKALKCFNDPDLLFQ